MGKKYFKICYNKSESGFESNVYGLRGQLKGARKTAESAAAVSGITRPGQEGLDSDVTEEAYTQYGDLYSGYKTGMEKIGLKLGGVELGLEEEKENLYQMVKFTYNLPSTTH